MNIFSICAVALATVLISLTIKKSGSAFSVIVCICGGVLILIPAVIRMSSVIESLKNLSDRYGVDGSLLNVTLKCLAVGLMTVFAAQTCLDSGESALSQKVYFAGKIMIVVIVLPYIEMILEKVTELI